jgi:hypothetical protein
MGENALSEHCFYMKTTGTLKCFFGRKTSGNQQTTGQKETACKMIAEAVSISVEDVSLLSDAVS